MKKVFLAAFCTALCSICCVVAAEPPPAAAADPAPRIVNSSKQDLLILDASGKLTRLSPGKWLVAPVGAVAVSQTSGKDEVQLSAFPLARGDTAVWGLFTHTAPAEQDPAAPPGDTDSAPSPAMNKLLKSRSEKVKSDISPSDWESLMVGEHDGVRVTGCGSVSIVSAKHCYAINCAGMLFRWIGPTSFVRASVLGGQSRSVTLTNGYWLATTELTRAQAALIQGKKAPAAADCDLPAVEVTWSAAQKLCRDLQSLSGEAYRLPTECEWENAAQAGRLREFGSSQSPEKLTWYALNSGGRPHKAATKLPNDWGIYDMHGNVYEWCEDYWSKSAPTGVDPVTTSKDPQRVRRGGFYDSRLDWCRSGLRDAAPPEMAFPYQGARFVATDTATDVPSK